MRHLIISLYFLFGVTQFFFLKAQDPVMVNFTMEDGLLSNQIHDLCIGSKGRLFIATDNGLCVYDGNNFQPIQKNERFNDIFIIKIFKDDSNRLWFVSLSGRVYYLENDIVKPYKYNQEIINFKKGNPYPSIDFFADSQNNVSISFNLSGLLKIDSSGIVTKTCPNKMKKYRSQFIEEFDDGEVIYYTELNNKYTPFRDSTSTFISIKGSELEVLQNRDNMPYDFYNYLDLKDGFCLSLGSYYYESDKFGKLLVKKFEKPIVEFLVDSAFKLFGFHGGGLSIIPNSNSEMLVQNKILNGLTISSIIKDNRNGFWIATIQSGIFYIPNINNVLINKAAGIINNNITAIASNTNSIFFGDAYGNLYKMSEDYVIEELGRNIIGKKTPIIEILIDKDRLILNSKNELKIIDSNGVNVVRILDRTSKTIRDIYKSPNGDLLQTGQNLWILKNNSDLELLITNKTDLLYYNTVCYAGDGAYWLGSNQGLYYYSEGEIDFLGKDNPSLASRISCISIIDDKLIIGSSGNGLLIYDPESNRLNRLDDDKNNIQSYVTNIFEDKLNSYWILSRFGLTRMSFKVQGITINAFNESHGVVTTKINDLAFFKSTLFLATDLGVICIDTSKLFEDEVCPNLIIEKIRINDEKVKIRDDYNLPFYKNNIEISYKGVDLREGKNLVYLYKISNSKVNFEMSYDNVLLFTELPPGNYRFVLKAVNKKNNAESSLSSISFTISPPFWKTWWFMSIETGFAISALSFIFIRRAQILDSNSKKEIDINRKIANLEMRALRTQMNPHFLFNSLNSIYSMINAGQSGLAGKFLLRFSKLLRIVIEQSPQTKISLAEEIRLLTIYIDLEKIRFNNKFDYELIIDDEIDPNIIMVPSFILQPFAENAIIHGLMNKVMGEKRLEIIIKQFWGELHIVIRDNGIGRRLAGIEKAKVGDRNKSVAISNSMQRLEMINIGAKNPIVSMDVRDLKDHNLNDAGTEVYLRIKKEMVDLEKSTESENS